MGRDVKIFYIMLLLLTVAGIGYNRFKKSKPNKYYICEVIRIFNSASAGTMAKYSYKVNGVSYTTSEIIDYTLIDEVKRWDRFLVSVHEGFEDAGIIMFEYPIVGDIEAPEEGWEEIPEFLLED